MLIDEGRQHVLATIQLDWRVLVSELSEKLRISRITIRKDLDVLEKRGLLRRSHGGAIAAKKGTLLDPSFQEKGHRRSSEKQRIAQAARELMSEGQCVLLDSAHDSHGYSPRAAPL